MLIKQLIARLQTFDPDLKVLIANEEDGITAEGEALRIFYISGMNIVETEMSKKYEEEINFKFEGPTEKSQKILFIKTLAQG